MVFSVDQPKKNTQLGSAIFILTNSLFFYKKIIKFFYIKKLRFALALVANLYRQTNLITTYLIKPNLLLLVVLYYYFITTYSTLLLLVTTY